MTKPEDAFARQSGFFDSGGPRPLVLLALSAIDRLPIAGSNSAFSGRADSAGGTNEGNILSRIEGLMLLITLAALFTSGLAVSAAMATAMFERRQEIGLMKALGAGQFALSAIFVTEAVLLACAGGLLVLRWGAAGEELGQTILAPRSLWNRCCCR